MDGNWIALLIIVFLAGAGFVALVAFWVLQRWSIKYRGKPILGTAPIPLMPLEEVDVVFQADDLGVTREAEVRLIGGTVVGGTSTLEGWILASLAKKSKQMFEFGTCTGRTTYAWAANSAPEARVTTLTLPPAQHQRYQHEKLDRRQDARHALRESHFQKYYYSDTDVAHKVEQLYGDSKSWDEHTYHGQCDLIFIDGSHAYSYVVSDSHKALQMLAPGGVVLWHDYRGPHQAGGVYRALNELARQLPLRRIPETSLVVYRKPAA